MGILTLTGNNTYTGTTAIQDGTLTFNGTTASLSSDVEVDDSGSADAMAILSISNAFSVNETASVDSNYMGSSGNVTLTSGAINIAGTGSSFDLDGTLALAGGNFMLSRDSTLTTNILTHGTSGILSLEIANSSNSLSTSTITINDTTDASMFEGMLALTLDTRDFEAIFATQNVTLAFSEMVAYTDANISIMGPAGIVFNASPTMRTDNIVTLNIDEVSVTNSLTNPISGTLPFALDISAGTTTVNGALIIDPMMIPADNNTLTIEGTANFRLIESASLEVEDGAFNHSGGTLTLQVASNGNSSSVVLTRSATNVFDGMLALDINDSFDILASRDVTLLFTGSDDNSPLIAEYSDSVADPNNVGSTIDNISVTLPMSPLNLYNATPSAMAATKVQNSNTVALNIDSVTILSTVAQNGIIPLSGDYPFDISCNLSSPAHSVVISGNTMVGGDFSITDGTVRLESGAMLDITDDFMHTGGTFALSVGGSGTSFSTNSVTVNNPSNTLDFSGGTLEFVIETGFDALMTQMFLVDIDQSDGTGLDISSYSSFVVNNPENTILNATTPVIISNANIATLQIDLFTIADANTSISGVYPFALTIEAHTTTIENSNVEINPINLPASMNALTIAPTSDPNVNDGTLLVRSSSSVIIDRGGFNHEMGTELLFEIGRANGMLRTGAIVLDGSATTNSFSGNLTLNFPNDLNVFVNRSVELGFFSLDAMGDRISFLADYMNPTFTIDVPSNITLNSTTPATKSAVNNTVTLNVDSVVIASALPIPAGTFPFSLDIISGTTTVTSSVIFSAGSNVRLLDNMDTANMTAGKSFYFKYWNVRYRREFGY